MAQPSEMYKDRIEVSLDGRHIFFLFFGGAVIACMVFVLGIVVGKQVTTKAQHRGAAVANDPLAALDRMEANQLQFRNELAQGQASAAPVDNTVAAIEAARLAEQGDKPKLAKADKQAADKQAADKQAADKQAADKQAADKQAADKQAAKQAADKQAADKQAADKQAADKQAAAAADGATKFTLQVASFLVRDEAEAFAQKVRDAGYKARVLEANVEGKTYYRVRSGTYSSPQAAETNRVELGKKVGKAVIVAKM